MNLANLQDLIRRSLVAMREFKETFPLQEPLEEQPRYRIVKLCGELQSAAMQIEQWRGVSK